MLRWVFAQLQEIFGDYLTDQDAFPTSEELGLDVVESFFEAVIPERLQELAVAIAGRNHSQIAETLRTQAEIFIGLAESLGLPGFGEIAQTIITALDNNSDRVLEIAKAAMANLEQAKKRVMKGDRERGGEPSTELLQLADSNFVPNSQDSERAILESIGEVIDELEEQVTSVTSATPIENQNDAEASFIDVASMEVSANVADDVEDLFVLSENDLELIESDRTSTSVTQEAAFEIEEQDFTDRPIENQDGDTASSAEKTELLSEIWGETASTDDSAINCERATQSETQIVTANNTQIDEVASTSCFNVAKDRDPEASSFIPPTKAKSQKTEKERKSQANRTVRVNLESLERLNDLVGELLINQNQNILKDEQIYSFVRELLTKINQSEQVIGQLIDSVEDVYISPEQQKLRQEIPQKLSEIANIVPATTKNSSGALQLSNSENDVNGLLQSIFERNSEINAIAEKIKGYNKQAQRNTQKQQRMLLNMRDELIETRMSPIGRVFNRFPRMLQQLSSTYNKPVDF